MPGCLPATADLRFSQSQLNSLTNSGLAIQGVAPSGNPMILREATQYQRNQYGQADTAFCLLTILSNLAELLSRMKSAITSKYPRVKLAPDGTRLGPGQAAVTPTIIKAELVAEARQAEYDGLMSNVDAFKSTLSVDDRPEQPEPAQHPVGAPAHGPAAPVRRARPVPPALPDHQPDLTGHFHPPPPLDEAPPRRLRRF